MNPRVLVGIWEVQHFIISRNKIKQSLISFISENNLHMCPKMILIPIGEIYAQIAKSATSYYSLILLPLTNFTLHPLTCCVIDKGIKGLV